MRRIVCIIALSLSTVIVLSAQEDLLQRSDAAFFPPISKFMCKLKNYEKGEYKNYYDITCYVKGTRQYLAHFINPPIARQQSHLRVGNDIWQYLGKIKKSVRLSAKANFSGSTFSEEDILSTSLGYFYNLEKVEKTTLEGKGVLKLMMATKSEDNAYSRIESFVDPLSYLPIKRIYYSYSDQKIKEMIVKEIKKEGGKLSELHLIMNDLLRPGDYSELFFSNFEYFENLPDRMFTKKYMEITSE